MILQKVYLKDFDWFIRVYYAVNYFHIEDIIEDLEYLECPKSNLLKAKQMLLDQEYNSGFTYSNLRKHESIMVIGITTSPEEFQNTFDHEKGHLSMHISEALNIDPFSELFQYLSGEIGQKLFEKAKQFLCNCCSIELDYNK